MPINMKSAQHTNEDEAAKLVAGPDPDAKPKPKRPLSAFNLFYRYKRQKVLKALAAGADASDKDTICELITVVPGLEHYLPTTSASKIASPDVLEPLRRNTIRKELEQNLEPRDTKTRAHRKNKGAMNGSMSFVEMGKIMNTSWKNCDPFAKSVFNELAEEGRARYRQRTEAYNKSKRQDITPVKEGKDIAYNATGDVNGGQKQYFTSEKMPTKEKSKLPVKKKLSAKKKISTKTSLLLPLKGDAHDYGTAEAMVELATFHASYNNTTDNCAVAPMHFPSKTDDIVSNKARSMPIDTSLLQPVSTVAPSILRPPSMKADNTDNEARIVPKDILRAKSHNVSPYNSSQQIWTAPPSAPSNCNSNEEMLMLRVRELEGQLEEERFRFRIRELEFERSQQNAREDLLRLVYDDVAMNQNRAMPPVLMSNNCSSMLDRPLQNLLSAGAMRPSMQAAERAAMLSRIGELQHHVAISSSRPFSNVPGNISSDYPDGRPIERQMTQSYFAARRG
mmetsp:Transcript_20585/g.44647  ORF Transcript_20585/g.44647 Transcript_20585/m.44647 type:complete len:507 (+) Transcript_20585:50-1570(+)